MVDRLRKDAVLRFRDNGPHKRRPVYPKQLDGHLKRRGLACMARLAAHGDVPPHGTDPQTTEDMPWYSSDTELAPEHILRCDRARFQVAFAFRDARQPRVDYIAGCESRTFDMSTNHRNSGVQQSMADNTVSAAVQSDVPAWRELAELMLAGHSPLAFVAGHLLLALQPLMTVLGVPVPRSRILQLMGLPPTVHNPEPTHPDDA